MQQQLDHLHDNEIEVDGIREFFCIKVQYLYHSLSDWYWKPVQTYTSQLIHW